MDSNWKFVQTSKTIGVVFNEQDLLVDQPDHSLLGLISKKKLTVLGIDTAKQPENLVNMLSYVFFAKEDTLLFIFSTLAPFTRDKSLAAFSETKSYHDPLGVLYMRRSLDEERKQFIHSR